MYPFFRLFLASVHQKPKSMGVFDTHVSSHRILPSDIDFAMELNNGRTLTIFDLGRVPLIYRTGFWDTLRADGHSLTMAGVTVRYRRRVRMFEKVTVKSRLVTWDARFVYAEQSMWNKKGECTGHVVYRIAITGPKGIVPPDDTMAALGHQTSPDMPEWIARWSDSEANRPWPPMQE